ncbi:MAG: PspC domain-containing protein [Dehalococcoidia bacterium]
MANKRLYRDTENALLGGVCAGFAQRLDVDLTLVRVVTIVLALVSAGTAILVYAALWIIMPAQGRPLGRPDKDALTEELRTAGERLQEAGGIIARAARQAADEISHVPSKGAGSRPAGGTPADAAPGSTVPGTAGDEAPWQPPSTEPDTGAPPPPESPPSPSSEGGPPPSPSAGAPDEPPRQ